MAAGYAAGGPASATCASDVNAGDNIVLSFPTESELRERCEKVPGKNPLDVNTNNTYNYSCGAYSLVERDIKAVLPPATAEAVLEKLHQGGVPRAFRVREELVNYKKVSLHIHEQGVQLERSLGQVAAFFREGERSPGGFWVHTERRTTLSDAHTQCKGRCQASFDARHMGKHICCVPRHPQNPKAAALEDLPRSLHCWKLGAAAKDLLISAKVVEPAWQPTCNRNGGMQHSAKSYREATLAVVASQPWPTHIMEFVHSILICRGVDKALRICDELTRTCRAFEEALLQAEGVLEVLRKQATPSEVVQQLVADGKSEDAGTDWLLGGAMLYHKHINLISGCLPLLQELVHWLRRILLLADEDDPGRLFVAGDSGVRAAGAPPVSFVPEGFGANTALDEVFFRVLRKYKPEMRDVLATSGWPEHVTQAPQDHAGSATIAARKMCKVCQKVSGLWVHRGICCECEEVARTNGRCPFNNNCEARWFCPHERRCFVCDCHSCPVCRIWRGDSDAVLDLVMRQRPARVFLDFDRTLATTRSGGQPFVGKHNVDQELLSLFWKCPGACAIVTRNPHVAEIRAFLASHGGPEDAVVHSLKRPRSKAEFILPDLASGDTAVFVDDSIAELVDPLIARDPRVFRVLFVRGML
eukprot:TRINITY_DN30961_c0_g1_i2.p1 TRINITY_DN30961_c0_g1~~TRINITY_DN30961_c0_g1_i2.p1  ORF type:complete len:676 (+),score=90.79 TRINITY_DN30961_c0_g1_i2:102-2030(+)